MSENTEEIYLARTNDEGKIDRDHLDDCEAKRFYKANVGFDDWHRKFKIDKPRHKVVYSSEYYTDERFYVLPQDLTEEGMLAFEIYNEDDFKEYVGENEDNWFFKKNII